MGQQPQHQQRRGAAQGQKTRQRAKCRTSGSGPRCRRPSWSRHSLGSVAALRSWSRCAAPRLVYTNAHTARSIPAALEGSRNTCPRKQAVPAAGGGSINDSPAAGLAGPVAASVKTIGAAGTVRSSVTVSAAATCKAHRGAVFVMQSRATHTKGARENACDGDS